MIAGKETVRIKGAGLTITNNGCGRKWIVEHARTATEIPFCELLIKFRDSPLSASQGFEPLYMDDLQIRMYKINPWEEKRILYMQVVVAFR